MRTKNLHREANQSNFLAFVTHFHLTIFYSTNSWHKLERDRNSVRETDLVKWCLWVKVNRFSFQFHWLDLSYYVLLKIHITIRNRSLRQDPKKISKSRLHIGFVKESYHLIGITKILNWSVDAKKKPLRIMNNVLLWTKIPNKSPITITDNLHLPILWPL